MGETSNFEHQWRKGRRLIETRVDSSANLKAPWSILAPNKESRSWNFLIYYIIKYKKCLIVQEIPLSHNIFNVRQVSSMIHSARPLVTPVVCCFVFLDLKSGDGRTDGRTTCAKSMIPTGSDFGLVEWIKNWILKPQETLSVPTI